MPIVDPGRAIAAAVSIACWVPTHSRAASTPIPPVSSRTACDGLVAACLDDVGGTEATGEALPVGVTAERDDPLGAQALRGQHGGEADGAVTDDRHRSPWRDPGTDGGVMAGRHHVGQRQQRAHHRVGVPGAGHRHERASRRAGTRTASP